MSAIKVLLVEDDSLIRMMVTDFLHGESFEVTEAGDGDEAAALLDADHELDILFTDVRMPGTLDGIDLARHARRQHPALPLLIVDFPPGSGRLRSERHAAIGMVLRSMSARASAGVR